MDDLKDISLNNQSNQSYFDFLSSKSKKLVTVLYMVTNLFPEQEPLKWDIRKNGVSFLSETTSLSTVYGTDREQKIQSVISISKNLIALGEIAHYTGMISEMNFSVLRREFEIFLQDINQGQLQKTEQNSVSIPSGFFSIARPQISSLPQTNKEASSGYKGQKSIKDSLKDITKAGISKNERKELILKILKTRGKESLSVKDFSEIIKDCSEKTIQRELQDLVLGSVLNKQGERRWSRYSIKH